MEKRRHGRFNFFFGKPEGREARMYGGTEEGALLQARIRWV